MDKNQKRKINKRRMEQMGIDPSTSSRFERLRSGIIIRIFLLLPFFAFAQTDHLLISQVQITGGSGNTKNDFIEIHNPTAQDMDLKGFRLVKRTKTGTSDSLIKSWTDSAIIKSYGYYLWANSDFGSIAVSPDVKTSSTISDDNGVALRQGSNDTGTIIDSLAWGEAENIFAETAAYGSNPGALESLKRKPADESGNGTDTNDNSQDFILGASQPRNTSSANPPHVQPDPTPAPQETPPPQPPQTAQPAEPLPTVYSKAVIISEFMVNPSGKDPGSEWVELYNSGNSEVDLSGWKLDDEGKPGDVGSSAYTFPSGARVGPFQYFVQVIPALNFDLDNSNGDSLRVFWPDNNLAAEVSWSSEALEDVSLAKKVTGGFEWTSVPTPGKDNSFEQASPKIEEKSSEEAVVLPVQDIEVASQPKAVAAVLNEPPAPEAVFLGQVAGAVVPEKMDGRKWEIFTTVAVVIFIIFLYTYFRFLRK